MIVLNAMKELGCWITEENSVCKSKPHAVITKQDISSSTAMPMLWSSEINIGQFIPIFLSDPHGLSSKPASAEFDGNSQWDSVEEAMKKPVGFYRGKAQG